MTPKFSRDVHQHSD